MLHYARKMRKEPTDAERLLWRRLRGRALGRLHFRRQTPIGPYIADFCCKSPRIVIELDGGQHADAADAFRDAWLAERDYKVLRFWNNEVLSNIEGVLEAILRAARS